VRKHRSFARLECLLRSNTNQFQYRVHEIVGLKFLFFEVIGVPKLRWHGEGTEQQHHKDRINRGVILEACRLVIPLEMLRAHLSEVLAQ